jgi:hypothetical protein
VSKKSYTTCEVVGVGLKYRKTFLIICLNILCFSFRKGGGVCGGTVVVHLSGENRINFFCIQIHDTVEFKLPVYPRTYEFLTKHPGARGTCSKKDNEFSIGVS